MAERRTPRVDPPTAAVPAKKRRSGRGTKSAKPAPSEKPSGESNEPTIAALEARRRETLQLVIAGVPLSAIADKYGLDISTISRDYRRAMANYYGPTQDEAASFRAEITERQRTLIMSNFAAAKAGDPKAAESAASDCIAACTALAGAGEAAEPTDDEAVTPTDAP